MSTAPAFSPIDTGILLEAGTNEAEILVFQIRDQRYGVNVAKVREVLPVDRLTQIPMSHEAIDGLVTIRDIVVPLINLERYLYQSHEERDTSHENLMLLEFNLQLIAFRVHAVERIYRITWQDTTPLPPMGSNSLPITSVLRLDSNLVPLIDFESIAASVDPGSRKASICSSLKSDSAHRADIPLLFADDSPMIRAMIEDALTSAGFTNAKGFHDGKELWEHLEALSKTLSPEEISEHVACILTDVEMPEMDGLSLTKHIRSNASTSQIPVIVFSSIASTDNEKKEVQVGATAQVAKPHYDDLIKEVISLF